MRKAIFFSIVTVFIVLLFVATTEMTGRLRLKDTEMGVTRTRVKILNSLIEDMETSYFERVLYVSAKNTMIGISRYYLDDPGRIEKDLPLALQDVIEQGILTYRYRTPDTVDLVSEGYIDGDYTVDGLRNRISEIYEMIGVNVKSFDIEILEDGVVQSSPWTIELTAKFDYFFEDEYHIASWKGSVVKSVNVTVYGVYSYDCANDGGHCTNMLNIGPITDGWREDTVGPYSELSVIDKLGRFGTLPGPGSLGICSPDYDCRNDPYAPSPPPSGDDDDAGPVCPPGYEDDC